ncbi:MAG TPA: hypothetical protein VIF15_10890, partial [Polyangiaceae bacterium]
LCGTATFDFYATFFASPNPTPPNCKVTAAGACSYYACAGTTTQTGLSAGTLTISGGSLGAPVAVTPDATNHYTHQVTGTVFTAGQTLTVSASGATVPAFGPHSVVAPGLVSITAPPSPFKIPTSVDLPVAWSGGESGAVVILEGVATASSGSYFLCLWDASLGQAVVPQIVLSGLAGQATGYLVYGQYSTTTFVSGGYSIAESALPFTAASASFQ